MPSRRRTVAWPALAAAALLAGSLLVGCSTADGGASGAEPPGAGQPGAGQPGAGPPGAGPVVPGVPGAGPGGAPGTRTGYAVAEPAPLTGRLYRADILVTGEQALTEAVVAGVRSLPGVEAALRLSVASASVDGRTLQVAAVDLDGFRRFAPDPTARAAEVWARVAGGEAALDTDVDRRLVSEAGTIRLGSGARAPRVRVGAYAPLVEGVHAVVNERRGVQLGIPAGNALLVSTGVRTPSSVEEELREVLGDTATTQVLALEVDVDARHVAVLTGASVARAVGSFTYTDVAGGEVRPDQDWVAEYIRTERVPILGRVTCNKAMLPQLRAALAEVVRRGLATEVVREQYAGCYYPRYIGRDPAKGLSLHSWGIAVDLNVAGNQRGTRGDMDPDVVEIFKRWGFAWGGDWRYTDPMHFEMEAVVRPGR